VAGFVLQAMGRLPGVGDAADVQGWRFEVVDLDGRRIDKVLAAPARPGGTQAALRPGGGPLPRGA
jgi:putative hemolysin